MSRSINKIILVGHVGRDPDVQTTASGTRVAHFSLATTRRLPRTDGIVEERTEWHRITAWDRLADLAENYIRRGDRLYIEGRMEYDSFEKNGITIPTAEIQVRELVMLNTPHIGQPHLPDAPDDPIEVPASDVEFMTWLRKELPFVYTDLLDDFEQRPDAPRTDAVEAGRTYRYVGKEAIDIATRFLKAKVAPEDVFADMERLCRLVTGEMVTHEATLHEQLAQLQQQYAADAQRTDAERFVQWLEINRSSTLADLYDDYQESGAADAETADA